MSVATQLEEVRRRVADAEKRSGRPAGSVQLMAVSKTFSADDVAQAYAVGQRLFGENRLQEALGKIPQLPQDCRWHLIGPLQRNKVRKALESRIELIQAVEKMSTAEAISRIAGELAQIASVLIEVNIDSEPSKHGFSAQELRDGWSSLVALPHLRICGLMCIPAPTEDPEQSRPAFSALRELAEELRKRGPLPLEVLSMGMSHDFEVAIEEGSTLVRVGSAIFGNRAYPSPVTA